VGLVMQYSEYQLFAPSVLEDVAFGPRNFGQTKTQAEAAARQALQLVGLDPDAVGGVSPFDLSGGQRRLAAMAGILAWRPTHLVLDEPMAGLDPEGRRAVMSYVKAYHEKHGTTVLFVTHSMEDAALHAGRLIVMSEGSILMQGTPSEIFERADELRKSGLSTPQVTDLFTELRRRGIDLPQSVYTVSQAVQCLKTLKKGDKDA